jgi:hypothetical protein
MVVLGGENSLDNQKEKKNKKNKIDIWNYMNKILFIIKNKLLKNNNFNQNIILF